MRTILPLLSIADFVSWAIESSERKNTQEALRWSEAQFRAVFERCSIGIGLVDMRARIVDTNPALSHMLDYSSEELYGKRFSDIISKQPKDIERYKQLIFAREEWLEIEIQFLCRDGKRILTILNVSLITNRNGKEILFIAILEDISKLK